MGAILCYGSIIWSHTAAIASVAKDLTKVQRLACLSITGASTSTPTAALEVLLLIEPIDLFVKQEVEQRLYEGGQWLAEGRKVGHTGIHDSLVRDFREVSMLSDRMETLFGSTMAKGTSAGVFCEDMELNVSIPLGTSPTVFQAEGLVVGRGCWYLEEDQVGR